MLKNGTTDNAESLEQPNAAAQIEESGAHQSKTFTQEEVNRIVQDRLARERAKSEPVAISEEDLKAPENLLSCKEFLLENNYPKIFFDIFDTSDVVQFKSKIKLLLKHFPSIDPNRKIPQVVGPTPGIKEDLTDEIAEVFKPKR